ncbi:MAG TPA: hypothetical protein VFX76_14750 [Roseiflexaceae bacterium]|nr:hypothetical protein [Roseiflexaceae bacterium]
MRRHVRVKARDIDQFGRTPPMHRRPIIVCVAAIGVAAIVLSFFHWQASAAERHNSTQPIPRASIGQRPVDEPAPGPAIEPYIRPEFATEMRQLRPAILAAAQSHNRPELSGMDDREFAVALTLVLYNENFGSLEDRVPPLRRLTPLYQEAQLGLNTLGASNLSVWPANLRPSVALEILRNQVPVPEPTRMITVPLTVAGSQVQPDTYSSEKQLYAALTQEIAKPEMAVEYLAANLERGVYRARFERVPVTWRALAAWHNQGIVSAKAIRDNPTARDYIRRTSAYMAAAYALIDGPGCQLDQCDITGSRNKLDTNPQ